MNLSVRHQDAACRQPLGVFDEDGTLLETVGFDVDYAYRRRAELAPPGADAARYEVLATCPAHPTVAAVDCVDCVPVVAGDA